MLALLTLAGLAQAAPEMIPEKAVDLLGRTAPTFEAKTFEGQDFSLQKLRGKTVVLSFWASWCTPCRQELPALSKLQSQRAEPGCAADIDSKRPECACS